MSSEFPDKIYFSPEEEKRIVEEREDRDVKHMLENLGISIDALLGKKVLDLGAGRGEFARIAKRNGAEVTSFGLNPGSEAVDRLKATGTPYIIGNATQLPFADASFDFVLSHAAIPNVVAVVSVPEDRSREALARASHERRVSAMREAVRVLRLGGEIRLAPVVRNERGAPGFSRNESMESMLSELKGDPGLEVKEEVLQKDIKDDFGITTDTYRIIIHKK